MRRFGSLLARTFAVAALIGFAAQPAAAQSILRDAETEKLFQDMVDPIAEAAGLQRGAVEIVLTSDTTINAGVNAGQRIYINAGLISAADTANEVQGVMAHEIGHIVGGHVIRSGEGVANATKISVLSMILGVAAAFAGAGDAAMGAMMLGQQAALGTYLSYSRTEEASADAASVGYLSKAGITGKGSLAFFGKLLNQEYRYGYSQSDEAGYYRTHPLSGDRISRLRGDFEKDPAWDVPPDPELEARFQRVKGKLYGYLATPAQTLKSYPTYMTGQAARYARAYAYHKESKMGEALAETDALIASDPADPYFLELKGQVLLESGKPREALEPLRRAVDMTGNDPLIASTFAHALLATEDPAQLDEAERVLKAAVGRDRENPDAWYQLGVIYGARGDIPRARLASAEQQIMTGSPRQALQNAEAAESELETGTPEWLRAQDVAMQARAELERNKDRR